MNSPRTTLSPQLLADWAEHRFHDTVDFSAGGVRLYGLTVLDPAAGLRACRLSFLGEVDEVGCLLGARIVLELANFDAAVLLLGARWLAEDLGPARPSTFGPRRRARAVLVADDRGVAATVRFAHRADDPMSWQPAGAEAAVLGALWRAVRH